MAGTEVSNVIRDILDAFQNGLNIFKGTRRKHKRRYSEPTNANEDKRIHDSLSQRPHEIKDVYDKSVAKHGHRFEIGDGTAQTSLAQILLVLNTGLIKLLNHTLSNDKSRSHSRSGIYNLSETAAMETLTALSELNLRMTSKSKVCLGLPAPGQDSEHRHCRDRPRAQSCSQQQQPQRPGPAPVLQSGGWVRSKSDPSVVSVVVRNRARKVGQKRAPASRSQSAAPSKSTAHRSGLRPPPQSKSPPPSYSQLATKPAPAPKPKLKPENLQAGSKSPPPSTEVSADKQVIRHPSMYIVPGDFFDVFPQLSVPHFPPRFVEEDQVPSMPPPKAPLHSRPQQRQTQLLDVFETGFQGRLRPPSTMTFMTASTKIGEIPEHKLPDRELTQEQQEHIPMPYVVPDMLDPPKKRAGRGLRFWKKDRQERGMVGAVGAVGA